MTPPVDPVALRQRLESLRRAGVRHLPRPSAVVATGATADAASAEPYLAPEPASTASYQPEDAMPRRSQSAKPAASSSSKPVAAGETTVPAKAATLEILAKQVAACTRCHELATTRTQTVFGTGNPSARICFLGEAPGADEDRTGVPFVGRAGQLLTKIIEACTLSRDDVYILNVLKCRPPGNRNPTPDEARNCRGYLLRQFELVNPEYICCLGSIAAQNLLETTETIGRLRGRIHSWNGKKVICTYHPAYLLRNPSAKKDTWEDMKLLMKQVGVEL